MTSLEVILVAPCVWKHPVSHTTSHFQDYSYVAIPLDS